MPDISEFSDEPGKIWKLTGPNSVHSPGPAGEVEATTPDVDYAALAAQAEQDHRSANERFQLVRKESELAAFRQLVFSAAAADIVTIKLSPSDQGDWMTIDEAFNAQGVEMVEVVDDETDLYDGASDLPDTIHSWWAVLPGVAYDNSKRHGDTAMIDIEVAVEGLLANGQPAPTVVTHTDIVGKTIASISTETEVMRDTFKDEVTVERTYITFTDGTSTGFGEVQMDLYTNN